MSFFQTYKKSIVGGIITVILATGIPTIVWFHNAYADDRYVQKKEDIRNQIQQIDHALFEIDQEISFATNPRDKAKYEARRAYYKRQKEALRLRLTSPNKK